MLEDSERVRCCDTAIHARDTVIGDIQCFQVTCSYCNGELVGPNEIKTKLSSWHDYALIRHGHSSRHAGVCIVVDLG